MDQPNKRVKRLLRDAAGEAHRRELSAELHKLEEDFQRWNRGEISPFELSDRIHAYHQGPNRKLYSLYDGRDPHMNVARALYRGILKEEDVHPDALAYVRPMLEIFKHWDGEDQDEPT